MSEIEKLRGLLLSVLNTPRGTSGRIILEPDEEAAIRAALSQLAEPAPAQTEQQPVAWFTDWPGRRVYADEPHGFDEPGLRLSGESIRENWHPLYAAPIAQTAPQPEQSGLVEALEEIASGLQAEFAWEVAEQALAAYRAALSAQGESHE